MDAEVPSSSVFRLLVFWMVLGILVEFLLIPTHLGHGLYKNDDLYYALLSPIVVWWFFRSLVPAKEVELRKLGVKGVRLLNFILGFYLASALRAAVAAFWGTHLGLWG